MKLYIEFKDNKMIEELKTIPDVVDKHDGSYELVRETVESLSYSTGALNINDLDLLYFMVVALGSGVDVKRKN